MAIFAACNEGVIVPYIASELFAYDGILGERLTSLGNEMGVMLWRNLELVLVRRSFRRWRQLEANDSV